MEKAARSISQMRNLGPVMERRLAEIDIRSKDDLRAVGAVEAFRRLKLIDARMSLNALYAMEAALLDIDWRAIGSAQKKALKSAAGV